MPIHGEFKHRQAQQRIAVDLGLPKENVFMLSSGDVLELDSEKAQVTGREMCIRDRDFTLSMEFNEILTVFILFYLLN